MICSENQDHICNLFVNRYVDLFASEFFSTPNVSVALLLSAECGEEPISAHLCCSGNFSEFNISILFITSSQIHIRVAILVLLHLNILQCI